jgi:hypothetical protein
MAELVCEYVDVLEERPNRYRILNFYPGEHGRAMQLKLERLEHDGWKEVEYLSPYAAKCILLFAAVSKGTLGPIMRTPIDVEEG